MVRARTKGAETTRSRSNGGGRLRSVSVGPLAFADIDDDDEPPRRTVGEVATWTVGPAGSTALTASDGRAEDEVEVDSSETIAAVAGISISEKREGSFKGSSKAAIHPC